MIQTFPAHTRYTADHGWLKSSFSFSFAEYYDPNNLQFGALRVLNDDIVQPGAGFGPHPHREMEIVSIVLSGQLQHQDSAGHTAVTTFGGVQRMSAGTGVIHSEMNPSHTEPVNFLQLWFLPDTPRLTPSYENTTFDVGALKNNLLPVVSKTQRSDRIANIHQDLTIYLSDLESGKALVFSTDKKRKIFVFVIEGQLKLNGDIILNRRDSARMEETPELHIQAGGNARFMLIDLP